ncbi:MAG: hypothetical protein ACREFU_12315 [Acetobacteraceae bacterium]
MVGTLAFIFSGLLIPLRLLPHSETKKGQQTSGAGHWRRPKLGSLLGFPGHFPGRSIGAT